MWTTPRAEAWAAVSGCRSIPHLPPARRSCRAAALQLQCGEQRWKADPRSSPPSPLLLPGRNTLNFSPLEKYGGYRCAVQGGVGARAGGLLNVGNRLLPAMRRPPTPLLASQHPYSTPPHPPTSPPSYEEVILGPIADAVAAARRPDTQVWLTMQGEMGVSAWGGRAGAGGMEDEQLAVSGGPHLTWGS